MFLNYNNGVALHMNLNSDQAQAVLLAFRGFERTLSDLMRAPEEENAMQQIRCNGPSRRSRERVAVL